MANSDTNTTRLNTEERSAQELGFLSVLDSRMVGQETAKKAAARAKRRAGNPLRNKRGPVYKALLIGKSRTGKTLTAETTALSLHGDIEALVRVDCAEYQHGHEVSRLLGAPPSYVGFDDPNGKGGSDDNQGADQKAQKASKGPTALLARQNLIASRKGSKCPITVILLDEIEKAHTSLKDVLLAIFDKGKIRLANNTETDFTDCIFFLTSNLGMEQLENFGRSIGFRTQEIQQPTEKDIADVVKKELKKHFRPEFLKRLDETVIFAPLTQNQLEKLIELELGFVQDRILQGLAAGDWFEVKFAAAVQAHLLNLALINDGGVAEVKQIIEREIIDALGGELEKKTIAGRDLVMIGLDTNLGKLTFDLTKGAGTPPKAPIVTSTDKPVASTLPVKNKVPSDLLELRQLIALKLIETEADRQIATRTISLGKELTSLSMKYGGKNSTDLDTVQKSFMTVEAHKLLWSKTANAHWFWKIYQGAAQAATALPLITTDVEVALESIRSSIGVQKVSPNYDPHKDTPVNGMRYLQAGVLLLEKAENSTTWSIKINALFR